MKNFVLLIDTSTKVGMCALAEKLNDDYKVIAQEYVSAELSHSEKMFNAIKDIIDNNKISFYDIKQLVYCSGPGSFTGLRISYSAIKGFFVAKGIQHKGVSTLKALVKSYEGETKDKILCAVIKSGKDDVFAYAELNGKELIKEGCYTNQDILKEKDLLCFGDAPFCKELKVSAKGMLSVLEEAPLDGINYLKASYAEKRRTT
ncbi:MAG TPA: tRNA (adenosine(37)-N6)-threonylcarbamoyltransferase complex dimerization subunit type 1 TsaB [bacterium]|nr:tRNA (adenosine(37)-N6)-threonylcarbamoyltransferase complex dimerization subunit type 1 TsaB [bacterium]